MQIGVIGDVFIDRYWIGKARGLSAESPIPVIDIERVLPLPGGAGNVRVNLETLGGAAKLLFKPQDARPNYPIKNRLMVDNHQLARWDENDWCLGFNKPDLIPLIDCDGIVVCDYGKGAITPAVEEVLVSCNLPLFVDTKRDPFPWLGHRNVWMFPNLKEYRAFEEKYNWFPQVVLKQGELGATILEHGHGVLSKPSIASKVVCVNGAGDTLLAAFVVAMLSGANIDYCLAYSQAASAVAVESPLTTAVLGVDADKRLFGVMEE